MTKEKTMFLVIVNYMTLVNMSEIACISQKSEIALYWSKSKLNNDSLVQYSTTGNVYGKFSNSS